MVRISLKTLNKPKGMIMQGICSYLSFEDLPMQNNCECCSYEIWADP